MRILMFGLLYSLLCAVSGCGSQQSSHAVENGMGDRWQKRHSPVGSIRDFSSIHSFDNDEYRIGDEWGKHSPTKEEASEFVMGRALRATAKVQLPFGAATGFYLGEFNGRHVFATNHHVCESAASCKNARIKFDILGFQAKVEEFYGSWTDVDLSLMSIKVPEDKVEALATVGRNFSFDAANEKGSELVTAGYGYAGNNSQKLVINYDDDCRVFSETGESRFMPDPDEKNPGPYKAWSYAIGCDVSHGDSGSAIVDRETGDVVGIVWTGRIPKAKKVQDSKFLDELLDDTGREEVWKELTYAVPANKIKEFLTKLVKDGALEGDDAKTISAVAGLKFRSAR